MPFIYVVSLLFFTFTLCKGDALQIISSEHADWWYARSFRTNKKGFIPNNYVQAQQLE